MITLAEATPQQINDELARRKIEFLLCISGHGKKTTDAGVMDVQIFVHASPAMLAPCISELVAKNKAIREILIEDMQKNLAKAAQCDCGECRARRKFESAGRN